MHIPVKQTMLANMVPDYARSTYMGVLTLFSLAGASTAGVFIMASGWLPAAALSGAFAVMGIIAIMLFSTVTSRRWTERAAGQKDNRTA